MRWMAVSQHPICKKNLTPNLAVATPPPKSKVVLFKGLLTLGFPYYLNPDFFGGDRAPTNINKKDPREAPFQEVPPKLTPWKNPGWRPWKACRSVPSFRWAKNPIDPRCKFIIPIATRPTSWLGHNVTRQVKSCVFRSWKNMNNHFFGVGKQRTFRNSAFQARSWIFAKEQRIFSEKKWRLAMSSQRCCALSPI